MKPEVYLDRLIKMRERGEYLPSTLENEVAACLVAGEKLTQLQDIQVPSRFARDLESSLRLHVRTYKQFQQSGGTMHQTLPRPARTAQRRAKRRQNWVAAVAVAAVLVLTFTTLITFAARSLPGDPLYAWKQAGHQFSQNFANKPVNRANDEINQLHNDLTDLSQVVNEKYNDDAIQQALHVVVSETRSSQDAVEALPAGTERNEAQQHLTGVLAEESQTLYHLLKSVDWSIKLNFTQQLGNLGNRVPQVTDAVAQIQLNGTLQIILTGANFAPNANFVIDGQLRGSVNIINSDQLVAVISHLEGLSGTHTFGVLNPDGTAAQMIVQGNDDDQQHPERDGTVTPTPGEHNDD